MRTLLEVFEPLYEGRETCGWAVLKCLLKMRTGKRDRDLLALLSRSGRWDACGKGKRGERERRRIWLAREERDHAGDLLEREEPANYACTTLSGEPTDARERQRGAHWDWGRALWPRRKVAPGSTRPVESSHSWTTWMRYHWWKEEGHRQSAQTWLSVIGEEEDAGADRYTHLICGLRVSPCSKSLLMTRLGEPLAAPA
jgi:hypothetical protein